MRLEWNGDVRQWLQENETTAITLLPAFTAACTAAPWPPALEPVAPADPAKYHVYQAEGLTVYYDRRLPERESLRLRITRFGAYKELAVADD